MVLASTPYDPLDYVRDLPLFLESLPPVKGGFYVTPDSIAEAVREHHG